MKIDVRNQQKSRQQMADFMGRLMRSGRELSHAAKFAEDFRLALHRPELLEMHVFAEVHELESAEHPTLRKELRESRMEVLKKIERDGFCIAFTVKAAMNEPAVS